MSIKEILTDITNVLDLLVENNYNSHKSINEALKKSKIQTEFAPEVPLKNSFSGPLNKIREQIKSLEES